MKKMITIFIIVLIIISLTIFLSFTIINYKYDNIDTYVTGSLSDYPYYIEFLNKDIPNKGYIPDAKTARNIARKIFIKKFGYIDTYINNKPFTVEFDEKNDVWIVSGNMRKQQAGGVPFVILRKSDGKVIAIWHDL